MLCQNYLNDELFKVLLEYMININLPKYWEVKKENEDKIVFKCQGVSTKIIVYKYKNIRKNPTFSIFYKNYIITDTPGYGSVDDVLVDVVRIMEEINELEVEGNLIKRIKFKIKKFDTI